MHEMSIMHNILAIVADTAAQQQAERVTRIDLAIGARAGVMIDALHFAFEAMGPTTIAAGAELAITEIPLRYRCPACSRETRTQSNLCPDCDCFCEIISGQELQITSIEIE